MDSEEAVMSYKVTSVDIIWMKNLVSCLNIGGVWGYKDAPIFFRKTGEKQMTLFLADGSLIGREAEIAEQVSRNRIVMKAAGIEFVDGRRLSGQ